MVFHSWIPWPIYTTFCYDLSRVSAWGVIIGCNHYNYQGRMAGQGVPAGVKVLGRVLRYCLSWLTTHLPLSHKFTTFLVWLGLLNPLEKSPSPYFSVLWKKLEKWKGFIFDFWTKFILSVWAQFDFNDFFLSQIKFVAVKKLW